MKIQITAQQLMDLKWMAVIIKINCFRESKEHFWKELKQIRKQFKKNGFETNIKRVEGKKKIRFESLTLITPHFFIANYNEIKKINKIISSNVIDKIRNKAEVEVIYGKAEAPFKILKNLDMNLAKQLNSCFDEKNRLKREEISGEDIQQLFSIPDFAKLIHHF